MLELDELFMLFHIIKQESSVGDKIIDVKNTCENASFILFGELLNERGIKASPSRRRLCQTKDNGVDIIAPKTAAT